MSEAIFIDGPWEYKVKYFKADVPPEKYRVQFVKNESDSEVEHVLTVHTHVYERHTIGTLSGNDGRHQYPAVAFGPLKYVYCVEGGNSDDVMTAVVNALAHDPKNP